MYHSLAPVVIVLHVLLDEGPVWVWEPDRNTAEAHPLVTHPFLPPQPLPWLHASLRICEVVMRLICLGLFYGFLFFFSPMASACGY